MKLPAKTIAWLLPLLLTACIHKTKQQPVQNLPPSVDTTPKPETTVVDLPPSVLTIPSQPLETAPLPQNSKPHVKHKKPTKQAAPQTAVNPPQTTVNPQQTAVASPAVSAVGQLSSGDSSDLRQQTMNSINAIEHDLNGIGYRLSDQEQKTATQIRAYVKEAKEALASGDVEGARTLAAKAKVLLGELSS